MRVLKGILPSNDKRQQRPESQNDAGANGQGQRELERKNSMTIHFYGILTEYLFVVVPLIAIVVVSWFSNGLPNLFSTADPSFAAAVLFGQTILKLASSTSNSSRVLHWEPVALAIALLIVIGLLPSIIVLAIILREGQQASIILQFSQTALFIVATLVFITLGTLSAKITYEGQFEKAKRFLTKETEREAAI